ncbi:MAG: low specificity L-threonine aldolase [Eubacterium sp.]
MIHFSCDYCEGAHPLILEALCQTNCEQTEGYEEDHFCDHARDLIRDKIACDHCDIHFLSGGTQTNLTFITHVLRPFEAVISADTGHICTHETGAIEATGHKIIAMPGDNGKLNVPLIKKALSDHTDHHMVLPKLVYLSNPTEIGTIYTKAELQAIHSFCHEKDLILFIDGARLASALTAESNDLSLSDYPKLCDAFYIGGTKCGALFGEALVIIKPQLAEHFNFTLKQRGGLFAKGRILGIQFEQLFKDHLYTDLGAHTNRLANRLKVALENAGFDFWVDSPTNQIFPILPNKLIENLRKDYAFRDQCVFDSDHTVVRFVTSWAMTDEMVDAFIKSLNKYL